MVERFSRRFRRSMKNFPQSKILPQSRWFCDDGILTGRAALGAEHEAGGTASYTTLQWRHACCAIA